MYDWSQFEVNAFYAAPRARVFRVWATPAGLTSFFIKRAEFHLEDHLRGPDELVEVSDTYLWTWHQPLELPGRVLGVVEDERVAFSFGTMEFEVLFEDTEEGGTQIILRQSGIADTDDGRVMGHLNCRSCWVYFLTNLKSVLEHGTDLRDRDRPDRVMAIEVGYAVS